MIFVSLGLDVLVKDIHFLITRTHYKEHHFVVGRYVISLMLPFILLFIIYIHLGYSVLNVFLASAILGTFAEWFAGWWFYKIMGIRLWTYHKYAITKYTSFLSIPLWGIAGILLMLIVKLFGN